jgi:hypothetical protein
VTDVSGDETPEVLLWSDTTLRVFSADSRSLVEFTTSAPILRATGNGDGTLLLLTEDALISRSSEEELSRIQVEGTQVNEMSVGDTDGDENPEIALGIGKSLRLYDNLETASSSPDFTSVTADVTRTVSSNEVAPGETVTVITEITGASETIQLESQYEPQLASTTVQSVTLDGEAGAGTLPLSNSNGSTVIVEDVGRMQRLQLLRTDCGRGTGCDI